MPILPPEGHDDRGRVLVIGSLNADLVMQAPRLPRAGETVLGASFRVVAGGKGANQAVAAARLGARVAMIGRVGDDAFGALVRGELTHAGVDIVYVRVDPESPTGTAQIVVDIDGQNAIVVASGANARLDVRDVMHAAAAWEEAVVVVLQLEIPLVTTAATIAAAAGRGLPIVLNLAPVQPVPADLLRAVTWLVLNEIEAEQLTGQPVRSVTEAGSAAAAIRHPGQRVVVTLGSAGAVLVHDGTPLHFAAPSVHAVDTTAAGDAFVGALAAGLQRRLSDADAVRLAIVAGSLACTKLGAIPSLPTAAEVEAHGVA